MSESVVVVVLYYEVEETIVSTSINTANSNHASETSQLSPSMSRSGCIGCPLEVDSDWTNDHVNTTISDTANDRIQYSSSVAGSRIPVSLLEVNSNHVRDRVCAANTRCGR